MDNKWKQQFSQQLVIVVLWLLLWRSINMELVTPSWQFRLSTTPSPVPQLVQLVHNLLKMN